MKKLFAILLAASMLLCMIPFIASADEGAAATPAAPVEIDSVDDIYGLDASGALKQLLATDKDYKLTADIVFGDAPVNLTKEGATEPVATDLSALALGILPGGYAGTFDGNGKSIVYKGTYNGGNGSSGFVIKGNAGDGCVIKDLTVGSAAAPLNYTYAPSKGTNTGIIASAIDSNKSMTIDGVKIYGSISAPNNSTQANLGMFLGNVKGKLTVKNSMAVGSLNAKKLGYIGGVIGRFQPGAATDFVNISGVILDVEIQTGGYNNNTTFGAGGLIGYVNGGTVPAGAKVTASNVILVKAVTEFETKPEYTDAYVGWYANGDTCVVKAASTFTNMELKTVNAAGASVKIADATLRFRATAGLYHALVKAYGAANVKAGMVVAEKSVATALGTNFKIDAANTTNVVATEVASNGDFYATVAVTSADYAKEYTALGYVSYTTDGTTWTTVYADAATTRSVSQVAAAALADVKDAETEGWLYKDANNKYSLFTADQQTKLASYVVSAS